MKIKILNINTIGLCREGITATQLDFMQRLDKSRFCIRMVSAGLLDAEVVRKFTDMGCDIVSLPNRKKKLFSYFWHLCKEIREEKYDIVYVHGSSAILSIELAAAWLCGCKNRIVHCHSTSCEHKTADRLLRPVFYKSYTQALACGTDAGQWLFPGRPFQLIRNGRDVETYRFRPEKRKELRTALGITDTTLAVGHVGNFTYAKNQGFLVQVMKELLRMNPEAKLFLMGDGAYKGAVEQLAAENGLTGSIVFTGNISNVPDMLQAMDVMVLPSLYEGLPLVSVEWQIAALPCILSETVTKECAYTDLVHFLSLEEPQQWAQKILELGKFDRAAYADTAIARTVESGFDLSGNAKQLEHLFMERVPALNNKKEEEAQ